MKVTDFKLIDSSVWIAYFLTGSFKELLEKDEMFFLSVLSLFEIKGILIKKDVPLEKVEISLKFVKNRSLLIDVNAEISEMAVDFSTKYKIPTIDSLIYASALKNNATLITLDNDFRGLDRVTILD